MNTLPTEVMTDMSVLSGGSGHRVVPSFCRLLVIFLHRVTPNFAVRDIQPRTYLVKIFSRKPAAVATYCAPVEYVVMHFYIQEYIDTQDPESITTTPEKDLRSSLSCSQSASI